VAQDSAAFKVRTNLSCPLLILITVLLPSYAHVHNTFLLEASFAQTKFKRETCHSTNQTGNAIEY
jgi:hypothetical protein